MTNSRTRAKHTQVWRRRKCTSCNSIWSTHEVIDLSTSHKVENHQKQFKPFMRDKLFVSIKDSLRHRKTATEDATHLTDTVISKILSKKSSKLTTHRLFTITHSVISTFDKTAGAVYKTLHS